MLVDPIQTIWTWRVEILSSHLWDITSATCSCLSIPLCLAEISPNQYILSVESFRGCLCLGEQLAHSRVRAIVSPGDQNMCLPAHVLSNVHTLLHLKLLFGHFCFHNFIFAFSSSSYSFLNTSLNWFNSKFLSPQITCSLSLFSNLTSLWLLQFGF